MRLLPWLALCLALPACALVQEKPTAENPGDWYPYSPTGTKDWDREGAYASLSGILGFESFDPEEQTTANIDTGDSDLGLGVRFGYRLKDGLAVEAFFESVTGYTLDDGTDEYSLDMGNAGLLGKFYLLPDRVQPYALLGVGWTTADVDLKELDKSGVFVRVGGGVDLYVTKDIALFGELNYNRMTGNLEDLDHMDAVFGVLFRF